MSGSIEDGCICEKCGYDNAIREENSKTGAYSYFCPSCGWSVGMTEKVDAEGLCLLDENEDYILERFANYCPPDWPGLLRNRSDEEE